MGLRGHLAALWRDRVRGWAFDPDRPDLPVRLVVFADGEPVARGMADRHRPDLIAQTKASGRHGFEIALRTPLARGVRHIIEVRREEDGAPLPNTPRALEIASAFDAQARFDWEAILAAAETDDDFEQRLAFLLRETEKLRAAYAERKGGLDDRQHRRRSRWSGETDIVDGGKPRALVIDPATPDPSRDAGSNAIISHMTALQRLGFEVSFAEPHLNGASAALEAIGVHVYKKPLVGSIEGLLRAQRGAYALVYLHRMTTAAKYLELARELQPNARILYSVGDLHHLRLARQAAVERRPELIRLAEQARRRELAAAWGADAVVTHSSAEAQGLAKQMPAAKIFMVPWAVEPRPVRASFADRAGVAFIGGYSHPPNVDAAHWLVGSVMPEVWRRNPRIGCLLVGSEPPAALKSLASDRVEIVGFAPQLAQIFERVRLTVAPLAFGAGLKGKVLDSLAAGIPCVCTPVAAEGFGFPPPLARLVGETPEALAALIVSMHEDAEANAEAAQAGLAFVEQFAAPAAVDRALGRAVNGTSAVEASR